MLVYVMFVKHSVNAVTYMVVVVGYGRQILGRATLHVYLVLQCLQALGHQ